MAHILTVVPLFRPVRSRVSPAGTVIPLRTMSEQEVLLALAAAASVKVQVEPLEEVLVAELLEEDLEVEAALVEEELLAVEVEVALLDELVVVLLDLGAAATRALEASRERTTAERILIEVEVSVSVEVKTVMRLALQYGIREGLASKE